MPSWNWSFARKDMEIYGTLLAPPSLSGPDHLLTQLKSAPAGIKLLPVPTPNPPPSPPPHPLPASHAATLSTISPQSSMVEIKDRRRPLRARHQLDRHANPRCRPHLRPNRPHRRTSPTPPIRNNPTLLEAVRINLLVASSCAQPKIPRILACRHPHRHPHPPSLPPPPPSIHLYRLTLPQSGTLLLSPSSTA